LKYEILITEYCITNPA